MGLAYSLLVESGGTWNGIRSAWLSLLAYPGMFIVEKQQKSDMAGALQLCLWSPCCAKHP